MNLCKIYFYIFSKNFMLIKQRYEEVQFWLAIATKNKILNVFKTAFYDTGTKCIKFF